MRLLIELDVAVVWAKQANNIYLPEGQRPEYSPVAIRHALTLVAALMKVDQFMMRNAPGEVCIVIAENQNEHRKAIKEAQASYRDPGNFPGIMGDGLVPIVSVKDTLHFVEKSEAPTLQLADLCCYIIKKAFGGDERFAELIGSLNRIVLKQHG